MTMTRPTEVRLVYLWLGWTCAGQVRFLNGKLQQLWSRDGMASDGTIIAGETEWRDVPNEGVLYVQDHDAPVRSGR